jgi:hypothetical protein
MRLRGLQMIVRAAPAGILILAASAQPAFAQASGDEPAGGAAAGEAIGATVGALVVTA